MDEEREPSPRRRFLGAAFVSVGSVLTGVAGCARLSHTESEDPDRHVMDALRRVDPKLVRYREDRPIPTGLRDPRGIAVDEHGALYAVGDRQIQVLGGMGGGIEVEGEPACLCAGSAETLYVGFSDHVEVFRRFQRVASWESPGPGALITAIAAAGDSVWVADSGRREALRYGPDGRITLRVGKKDPSSGYPGLIAPSPHLDVAVGRDGQILLSNPGMHRIETHTADGTFLSSWGKPSSAIDAFCGCCNPTDFALFPDGRFVTAEKGIPRVKVYSPEGKFEAVVAGPDAFPSATMGLDLAVARNGRTVFVLDPKAGAVRVFQPVEGTA